LPKQHLRINQNLGSFKGGSLPNVNNIATSSSVELKVGSPTLACPHFMLYGTDAIFLFSKSDNKQFHYSSPLLSDISFKIPPIITRIIKYCTVKIFNDFYKNFFCSWCRFASMIQFLYETSVNFFSVYHTQS
jgi:hypothetical protein